MNCTIRIVAGLCIFSTLFTGCYSSALIDPTGDEKDRIYTDNIKMVISKDGTKYEFDPPATVGSNAIVGTAKIRVSEGYITKQVSIPMSDVEKVQVSQFSPTNTILLALGLGAIVALVFAATAFNTADNAMNGK